MNKLKKFEGNLKKVLKNFGIKTENIKMIRIYFDKEGIVLEPSYEEKF